ncbi:hypothetical protein [Actinacidiphila oryziradicis]|uniref:hypothetical protein n=1 Tax=Actinacidiphila oryziradicis TaxID=2571141 RepID=UPI0023F2E426|nr:hypothetical protein [Actinacidiphila oryziradicis]MCW2870889.1 hypothetical protein [Actinacidiphila oryziradicis]
MDLLADIDQLSSRLQNTVDPTVGTQALMDASGLVRELGRQTYSFVEDETVVLAGGDRVLRLPQRPVVVDDTHTITCVELGDFGALTVPLVEHRDWERNGDELTRAYPYYWARSRLMGWPYNRPQGTWMPRVEVTYSHGYQVIPPDIVAIVLDVAQALITNPDSLRSKTVGGYSETFDVEHLRSRLTADLIDNIRYKLAGTGRRRGAFSVRMQ